MPHRAQVSFWVYNNLAPPLWSNVADPLSVPRIIRTTEEAEVFPTHHNQLLLPLLTFSFLSLVNLSQWNLLEASFKIYTFTSHIFPVVTPPTPQTWLTHLLLSCHSFLLHLKLSSLNLPICFFLYRKISMYIYKSTSWSMVLFGYHRLAPPNKLFLYSENLPCTLMLVCLFSSQMAFVILTAYRWYST